MRIFSGHSRTLMDFVGGSSNDIDTGGFCSEFGDDSQIFDGFTSADSAASFFAAASENDLEEVDEEQYSSINKYYHQYEDSVEDPDFLLHEFFTTNMELGAHEQINPNGSIGGPADGLVVEPRRVVLGVRKAGGVGNEMPNGGVEMELSAKRFKYHQ